MSTDLMALIWLGCGIVLCALEFVVPGVILVFFGFGAFITALLVWLGMLGSLPLQLLVFCVASVVLLFSLRRFLSKQLVGRVSAVKEYDEGAEFHGRIARVTQQIEPGAISGRVFFQGSEWKAEANTTIPAGASVSIVCKKNITLQVRPAEEKE